MPQTQPNWLLHGLLTLLVLSVSLFFIPGWHGEKLLFTLYRESKSTPFLVGSWLFIAAFLWTNGSILRSGNFSRILRLPAFLLLTLVTGLCVLSLAWARVPEYGLYEVAMWLTGWSLALVVAAWLRLDSKAWRTLTLALIASALVNIIAWLIQLQVNLPGMVPLYDYLPGESLPANQLPGSFQGGRNLFSHLMLGQYFLLILWAHRLWRSGSRWLLVPIGILLAETIVLGMLTSRTTQVALLLAFFIALGASWLLRDKRERAWGAILIVGLAIVLATTIVANKRTERYQKLDSNPRYGLWLNTLNMLEQRPMGVGIGQWQVEFPVYRTVDRDRMFNTRIEARRAHNDHLQIAAELGWIGGALWVGFVLALLWMLWKSFLQKRSTLDLLIFLQAGSILAGMTVDYVQDSPILRLQLMLLLAFALARQVPAAEPHTQPPLQRPLLTSLQLGATALVIAALWYQTQALNRMHAAGMLGAFAETYSQTSERARRMLLPTQNIKRDYLEIVSPYMQRFEHKLGINKSIHRDWQRFAQWQLAAGDWESARDSLQRALDLHPYGPSLHRSMAKVLRPHDREAALKHLAIARYVQMEARLGYKAAAPLTNNH